MAATITPRTATTAHQRWVMKVPDSTRNSLTNPLRPGTPMEASMATVNTAAITGAAFCSPRSSPVCHVPRRW